MRRFLYSLLLYLLLPLILLRLFYRSIKNPDYRHRIPERFGFYKSIPQFGGGGIWVHAVSVGEAIAAVKLIQALQGKYPDTNVTVTCGTPTGSEIIQKQLGSNVFHVYAPYDLPGAVKRFLQRIKPDIGIIMETEIWPNLFHQASEAGTRLLISNMRLSESSFESYQKIRRLIADSLACVEKFAAQTDSDAARTIVLGADASRVEVVGNLKFESAPPDAADIEQRDQLKQDIASARTVWIAGSTHEGEDEIVLQAHRKLLELDSELLLILVPRHPERFDSIFKLCYEQLNTMRRSELGVLPTLKTDTQVLLLDTIGELGKFIAISDWAFIGGSLVEVGGHNILEACQAGVPVIYGPHMFNFTEIAQIVEFEGAGQQVQDGEELQQLCAKLLSDPELRETWGAKGESLMQRNRGALDKTLTLFDQLYKKVNS